jgi:hypothetical protein
MSSRIRATRRWAIIGAPLLGLLLCVVGCKREEKKATPTPTPAVRPTPGEMPPPETGTPAPEVTPTPTPEETPTPAPTPPG